MANIFLSYDRDDEARARPIAALLERAGHDVWWDRQIKGGHEFGTEIEAALAAADKVVVLWSAQSVKSAWVRDEAAVGRDTGRLVPATIDGTPAPLGFRQFQTINLSKRKGRGASAELAQLLEAIGAAVTAKQGIVQPTAPSHRPPRPKQPLLIGGAAALLLAGVIAAAWLWMSTSAKVPPLFAIVAADASPASQQAAHDLATRVSAFDDPASRRLRLVEAASDAKAHANILLKVGSSTGGQARELQLVQPGDEAILWSTSIEQPNSQAASLPQQAAVEAQRALSCANDAVSYTRERIDQETLKLYLSGCVRIDNAYGIGAGDVSLASLFEQVIAKAPHFAPAWSKLFSAEYETMVGGDRDQIAGKVQAQLKRAKSLGIDVAESYAAKAGLISADDFLSIFRIFDEGIAKHPENAPLFRYRGERLMFVGRMNDAVADTGQALQLDRLSAANWQTYASALAYSGDPQSGYEQLRKAEQMWPDAPTIGMARFRLDLRFGDPKEALVLYRKYAGETFMNPAQAAFIEARIDPTPENVQTAIDAERKINAQFPPFISSLIQALGQFGQKDEAIDLLINYKGDRELTGLNAEVLFRPAMKEVWRDPRSLAGAARMGLLHYWKVSGNWPDFCFDPKLPYDCKKEAAKYPV